MNSLFVAPTLIVPAAHNYARKCRYAFHPPSCGVQPLTPRERGQLRHEAVRRMRIGEMAQYAVSAPDSDDSAVLILWARKYITPITDLLHKYQLLKVKVRGARKRRRAERLGTIIAEQVNAQITQSLGHTVLLYKSSVESIPPLLENRDN